MSDYHFIDKKTPAFSNIYPDCVKQTDNLLYKQIIILITLTNSIKNIN